MCSAGCVYTLQLALGLWVIAFTIPKAYSLVENRVHKLTGDIFTKAKVRQAGWTVWACCFHNLPTICLGLVIKDVARLQGVGPKSRCGSCCLLLPWSAQITNRLPRAQAVCFLFSGHLPRRGQAREVRGRGPAHPGGRLRAV